MRVQNSSEWRGQRQKEILSAYSVEEADEEAMTAFILASTCRRKVLSQYMDQGSQEGSIAVDCIGTDSVYCDRCKTTNGPRVHMQQAAQAEPQEGPQGPSGRSFIDQQLRAKQEEYDAMIQVMDELQGRQCIYCALMHDEGWAGESISGGSGSKGELHEYNDCLEAEANQCGFVAYEQWRPKVDFGQAKHCYECGLSQSICRRLERPKEDRLPCEYSNIMLPSIFILQQDQHLEKMARELGFQGDYGSDDLWEWLNGTAEGWGLEWESNWMELWALICTTYIRMYKSGQ